MTFTLSIRHWKKLKELLRHEGFNWFGEFKPIEKWDRSATYKTNKCSVQVTFTEEKPWGDVIRPRKVQVEVDGQIPEGIMEFLKSHEDKLKAERKAKTQLTRVVKQLARLHGVSEEYVVNNIREFLQ